MSGTSEVEGSRRGKITELSLSTAREIIRLSNRTILNFQNQMAHNKQQSLCREENLIIICNHDFIRYYHLTICKKILGKEKVWWGLVLHKCSTLPRDRET